MFANGGISTGVMLINEMMVILGIGILLLLVEPIGTIIVISVLGLAGWGFNYITKQHITNWGKARQYHEGLRIQHLQQGLNAVKDIKVLGRELEFLEQHHTHHILGARTGVFLQILQSLPRLWLELLAICGLTILALIMLVQGRELGAIMPVLGVFAAAGFRVLPSIGRLINSVQTLRFSLPAINTLCNEINSFIPIDKNPNQNNATFNKLIEFQNVCYTYPGANKPALNDISLKVKQGASVGIIGNSGAGKTTFIDILLGLLAPEDGKVSVDGFNIQERLRPWQDQIGYVPQSIYLSDNTLRNNVAFGIAKDNIDEDAVIKAIHAAQLEEHVDSLTDGLNTIIGEHGVRLSGGQRQRIGIARALYHNPSILVLDEATSALDKETESGVMDAVYALQGSKTVIIVAHRLSTIENCDYLYKFSKGKIIKEGKFEDVLHGD
jgi:ABC-type multidrug transport system fused ATPase/permease subunit